MFTKCQKINFNPLQAANNSQSNKSMKFQYFVPCMTIRNVYRYFSQKNVFHIFLTCIQNRNVDNYKVQIKIQVERREIYFPNQN